MELENIRIELLSGASVSNPQYIKDSSGFDLRVNSFKRLFKGAEEIDLSNNLKHSIEKQGKITLRPFERLVIGTGLIISLPQGYKLDIVNKPSLVISQGLSVLSPPIDNNYKGELDVIIYNGSQFLNEVKIGMIVANGILAAYKISAAIKMGVL